MADKSDSPTEEKGSLPAKPDQVFFKKKENRFATLGLIAGLVGLFFAKDSRVGVGAVLGVIYICGAVLVWHTAWIEDYRNRQIFFLVLFGAVVVGFGSMGMAGKKERRRDRKEG